MDAEVGTVFRRAVLDVEGKRLGLEKSGVFGKEAEKDAHEEALEVVSLIASVGERVVQVAEDFNCPDVDGVFFPHAVLLVARDESEVVKVLVEFLERELGLAVLPGFEEGKVRLILGFEVVERDPIEVGENDIARQVVTAVISGEVLNVRERLRLRLVEAPAEALVFGEHHAAPEKVDVAILSVDLSDGLFERGQKTPPNTENGEELVPERLGFRLLARLFRPLAGEVDGVLPDFIPT